MYSTKGATMKKYIIAALALTILALNAHAHCQIPCGIYDDVARIKEMEEHVTTIEKSMKEIVKLTADTPQNINQRVRWVNNKEQHADKLTEIVTAYFLTQRIKPTEPAEKYEVELKTLHGMMIASMKAKQTVDLKQVEALRKLIHQFENLYFGKPAAAPHTH
jgi:nickel superoxide dismutase